MKQAGFVIVTTGSGRTVSLTAKSLQLLSRTNKKLYAHYMNFSNDNHPGGSRAHIEGFRKASGALACMAQAGVRIGIEKPSLQDITDKKAPKLPLETPTFYLNKELRYEWEQKIIRGQQTRSQGILFSRGLCAQVYNAMNIQEITIPSNIERERNFRMVQTAKELYQVAPTAEVRDSILIAYDDDCALELLRPPIKRAKKKTLGTAVWDGSLTRTDFHYIPMNEWGICLLRLLTSYTQDEILSMCFTRQERDRAQQTKEGDGIISRNQPGSQSLVCYEFVSGNVSKLARIKRHYEGHYETMGIICTQAQRDFVLRFMNLKSLNIRVLPTEKVQTAIKTSTEGGDKHGMEKP